jgi:hypothetical protein
MSLTSAECTEVEYATERYSESPLPVGTKPDKGDTATPKRRRGSSFVQRIQVELDSSSGHTPTSSRSIYLREIHRQIDHNEMLQRRLAHSRKLLHDAERIAMGEGNVPASQAVRLVLKSYFRPRYHCSTSLGDRLLPVSIQSSRAKKLGQG